MNMALLISEPAEHPACVGIPYLSVGLPKQTFLLFLRSLTLILMETSSAVVVVTA